MGVCHFIDTPLYLLQPFHPLHLFQRNLNLYHDTCYSENMTDLINEE